jgi:NAD-dependent DNA ligase
MARTQGELEDLLANPTKVVATWDTDKIATWLKLASDAYYNEGEPIMSDEMFDMLKDVLEARAPNHPFLKEIGAPIAGENKVALPYWMGSLDKIRDDPKQLQKWKTTHPGDVVISDKLDGNSAMLVHTPSGLRMYSRGNGNVGQDISHLLPFVKGIPQNPPAGIAVRGELIISKKNWERIKNVGANARNVVAGALHRKQADPKVAFFIDFVAYELLSPRTMKLSEQLLYLREHGFLVVHFTTQNHTDLTVESLSKVLLDRRNTSPYECDGIVIVQDSIHKVLKGKNPTYGFAYKSILTHDEAEVVVTHIEWNISKDGYIKPTVVFPPVVLSGATLQKVTAFNASFVEKNVLGPGAKITIIRSGDVIPYIVRVSSPAASGKPSMPDMSYEWTDSHVDIRVQGDSKDQQVRVLEHFAATLDLPNVATGTLKKLVQHGFDTIPKLLTITVDDLLKIDGFQKTSATNVWKGIQKARQASCTELMAATNTFGRGLGKKKLDVIVKAFPNIVHEKTPTKEELCNVPGIGDATASSFLDGLPRFFEMMKNMKLQCTPASPAPPNTMSNSTDTRRPVVDLHVVFTGFRNAVWEKAIEDAGGKVHSSVSKNVNVVVAADPNDKSSKLTKARDLGITIMSQVSFQTLYRV